MYDLLHHADALARQLEAAGIREDEWSADERTVRFEWSGFMLTLGDDAGGGLGPTVSAQRFVDDTEWLFRVGDPLPDALVAAVKGTAHA